MTNFQNLSEFELQAVIENAEKALKDKQVNKRKEVLAQIRELAASINVIVEIHESDRRSVDRKSSRLGIKVPVKYRHPSDPEKSWTGRGVTPKWLQSLLDEGHERAEFEV